MLPVKSLTILLGLLCCEVTQIQSKEDCHYYYNTQPGSTAETCSLNNFQFLTLQCQVSSDKHNYGIDWHYSRSRPGISTINDNTKSNVSIDNVSVQHEIKLEMNTNGFNRTSLLTLSGFDITGNGYYWCSVNSSNNAESLAFNPSTVLHITQQTECSTNEESCKTEGDVLKLHSPSSTVRCADQKVELHIVEAQSCPRLRVPSATTTTLSPTTTNIVTTVASTVQPPLSLQRWIVIGASVGGSILFLLVTIGLLLLTCLIKKKLKRQTREHRNDVTEPSPFDDIRMYCSNSVANVRKDKVNEKGRVSKVLCESNIAYECPQVYTSQPSDNIYEYIN